MKINISGIIIPNEEKQAYDWYGMESTCPADVQDALESARGQPIDVYINSGGGDVFSASVIYSALRDYEGEVKIHIVGIAASAASVIACAAKSDISPTATIMIHNAACISEGDYHEMDKTSDTLQKINRAVATAYVEKTGMKEVEVLALMDTETWLTAQDAVKLGLIDKVSSGNSHRFAANYYAGVLPHKAIEKANEVLRCSQNKIPEEYLKALTKLNFLKMKGGN